MSLQVPERNERELFSGSRTSDVAEISSKQLPFNLFLSQVCLSLSSPPVFLKTPCLRDTMQLRLYDFKMVEVFRHM